MDEIINGCSPNPLATRTEDAFEYLHRAVEELERHVTLLARTHGPAMTGVLADLVDDVRHGAHGAQRTTATRSGGLRRMLEDSLARLAEYATDEQSTMAVVEEVLEEVERRNRRSHATTSRSVAKLRKIVDQYHQGD